MTKMRFKVIQKNDGPFRMYQVVDTDYKDQVVITTSNKAEADELCELQNVSTQEND
jgi:hypothetical protein